MNNPIETISRTHGRLARLAAERIALAGLPPVAVAFALGASLSLIATRISQGWGYQLPPDHALSLRLGAFVIAGLGAITTVVGAWRAWRRENDFERAAEKIDLLVRAHQEVLTFATLADPAHPAAEERRSPLFALLSERASAYLGRFDPQSAFPLAPGASLKRGAVGAAAAVLMLAAALVMLLRLPTPLEAAAQHLRDFADSTAASGVPAAEQLAAAARSVANDLANPKLPPEQKLAELEAIKRQIEQAPPPPPSAQSGSGSSQGQGQGNAQGNGNGAGSGNGSGAGKGEGGKGEGTGTGGKNQAAFNGNGAGGQNNKNGQQQMSLKNDLTKAQAKLETEVNSNKSSNVPTPDKQFGSAQLPGENPNQGGPQAGHQGNNNLPMPEPGKLGLSTAPPSATNPAPNRQDNGTQGDTHLGDFPKQVAYERFYKLGDKGPALDLRDARYVTFRLPPAVVANGGQGRLVHDSGAPAATTPYTNAPLKQEQLVASPDEEQLMPPRYRDLIR